MSKKVENAFLEAYEAGMNHIYGFDPFWKRNKKRLLETVRPKKKKKK